MFVTSVAKKILNWDMCPVKMMSTFEHIKYNIFHAISQDTILKEVWKADSQSY